MRSGILILSCYQTHALYAIDPKLGRSARITFPDTKFEGQTRSGRGRDRSAEFSTPCAVALSSDEDYVYVADQAKHRIVRVQLPDLLFSTVAAASDDTSIDKSNNGHH